MDALQQLQALRSFLPELERRGYHPQVMQNGAVDIKIDSDVLRLTTPEEAGSLLDAPRAALTWIVDFIDEHPEWESDQFPPATAEAAWLNNARSVVRAIGPRQPVTAIADRKTVIESINRELWVDFLYTDVCDIEADSVVGFAVVGLLNRVEKLLGFDGANHDCHFEPKVREAFIDAALHQVRVWYYG